jgi:hypothetical protein
MIWDLQITERDGLRVHRSRLEPGEASPWHVDSVHRVTVVLQGEQLRIEPQDGGEPELVPVVAGQVHWDEPSAPRVHRAVNSGQLPYEEVVVALIGGREAPPILAEGSPSTRVVVAHGDEPKRHGV